MGSLHKNIQLILELYLWQEFRVINAVIIAIVTMIKVMIKIILVTTIAIPI